MNTHIICIVLGNGVRIINRGTGVNSYENLSHDGQFARWTPAYGLTESLFIKLEINFNIKINKKCLQATNAIQIKWH